VDRPFGAAVRLCGRFEVAIGDRDVSQQLPGRQGRLLLAYLACKRGRPVTRDELIDLLWPSHPPARPDEVLGPLLSRLRRALGPGVIEGRHDLTLVLPEGAQVDLEIATDALERAEAALAAGDAERALNQARVARELTEPGFLPGFDNPWVEERRRQVEELHLRALGCIAAAGVSLGGAGLGPGERAARELISAAPLHELGYRLLMEILAARGDVAAALQTYESLRVRLRDELGIAPGPAARAAHERLLAGDDQADTHVGDRPETPEASHREERKLVTVLAAQLEATATSEDPEDLRVAQSLLLERISGEVGRFGGSVESHANGVVVALFGATVAHEDDAERAVRAAVRLRELQLAMRVGVATGEVLVARDAPAGNVATGRAIDDAIRIQRTGPSGSVVADEPTVRATAPDAVVYSKLGQGEWMVQGVSDRLAAALEHPVRSRFLGRENELTLLEGLHNTVVEHRHPSMVLIIGDAGVGKSRLVGEFLGPGELSAPSVYRGRCLAYGEGTTYWALREILWSAAGIRFDDPASSAARKLADRVAVVVDESEVMRVTAALAIASGIALPDNPLERLTPGSVADEIALAWPAFMSGLAALAPAIMVIEDLHWAEEPLLEMLERMIARSTGPLLLVATARPELAERRPGWSTRPGVWQISLEPLTDAATRQLVAELLPRSDGKVRERVVATAEGNPFFAEELARHLSGEHGALTEVPNTVRAVLAARVDRLPEAEKQVLQDAAVIGRVFWASGLDSVEPRRGLREALRALEDRELVVTHPTSSLPGNTELSFRHGLTREVAYRSIPRAQRCRTHAAVGEWIEHLAGDRRDEFIDLLAYHYEAASAPCDAALAWSAGSSEPEQLRKKAVAALIEAGDAARRRASIDQALRFAERADTLAATDHERLAAVELQARSHHAAVRSDDALAAYTGGMELAHRLGDTEAVSRLRAHAMLLCSRYAGAFSGDDWKACAIELTQDAAAEHDDDSATFERAALLLGRSWVLRRIQRSTQDFAAAKRDAAEALAIAEQIDSPELLATALEALAWTISEEGFCDAETMAKRLIRAGTGSPDPVEAHESKVSAVQFLAWAGRFERAIEVSRGAASEAVKLSRHRALHSAMAEATCLVPTGRFLELGEATNGVLELADEDASSTRTCMAAVAAIAGRALWLHESLESDAASSALDLINRVRPPPRPRIYEYIVAEMLRPVVGIEATRAELEGLPPPKDDAAATILYLRAQLPVLAQGGPSRALATAIMDARHLARSACAPALGWIAEWAAATQTAATDPGGSLERALAATTALARYGEAYTAALLLSESLPLFDVAARAESAEKTAQRLSQMGALASATRARGAVAPSATEPQSAGPSG
jgi:predicted ATPase/DNA-binding SARP family transcriptional activator